jgi:hypothetical protein
MSLKGFSQKGIDSISIQLKKPVVRLVIKDLIKGDGYSQQLTLTLDKVRLLEQKVILKDSIISNLNLKINNLNTISLTKSEQLSISQELSKRLQSDLKKQHLKTRLVGGVGIVAVIGTIFILK